MVCLSFSDRTDLDFGVIHFPVWLCAGVVDDVYCCLMDEKI